MTIYLETDSKCLSLETEPIVRVSSEAPLAVQTLKSLGPSHKNLRCIFHRSDLANFAIFTYSRSQKWEKLSISFIKVF